MGIKELLKKIKLPRRNISESQNKSKNKVKNTKNNAKNNAISVYDTEAMYIPQYVELSEEEKKQVDKHEKEIDIENTEKIILYADETSKKANMTAELILKILFRIREIPQQYVSKDMDVEEVYIRRLDAMIRQEQLKLHRETMQKLEKDITLQIIALERQYEKETKRKIDFLGVFKIQKKIRRNDQLSQLRNAIERTKIVKQTIGYQIYAIDIEIKASKTEENIANENNIFNLTPLGETRLKGETLERKANRMRKILSYFLPNHLDMLITSEHEEEMVVELANIQNMLDIYAYKHKKDINQKLSEAIKRLKTVKNEDIENEIKKIQALHDAFEDYISSEEAEKWYRLKLKYILARISEQEELTRFTTTPFPELKYTTEYEFYKKIVEDIVEDIIKGQDKKFNELLGKERNNAIKYIKEEIKLCKPYSNPKETYSEMILGNLYLLLLITSKKLLRNKFIGNFTILSLEQISNSEVIEKRGTRTEMTDFSILLGGREEKLGDKYILLKDDDMLVNVESGSSFSIFDDYPVGKFGFYWTKTRSNNEEVYAIDDYGNKLPYDVRARDCGIRVALPFTSISNIPTNGGSESIKRAEDGVLEVEYGYYPQMASTKTIQKELENAYKDGVLSETGNHYTIDHNRNKLKFKYYDRYCDDKKWFKPEYCIEYEYKGKRYIRLEMNSLSNENCNLCPKRIRCYTVDKLPLLDEKTYIKSEFVSYRQQDITSKKNEKTYIKGDFVWVEVTPIKWLIDEKLHMMITEKIILAGLYYDKGLDYVPLNFWKSDMKKFLCKSFSYELKQIVKESNPQMDFWQEEEYEHEI